MNRTILSLAIIKTHWEKYNTDYIDNFIPMFGNLLVEKKYDEVDIETLKVDFQERYGLEVPINPLITIVNRAVKKKLLNRQHGKFYINHAKISDSDYSIESATIERKFKNVILAISSYAKNTYGIDPTEEDIETALLAFLKQHDLDILFATKDKSILPEVTSTRKLKYLISSFAIHVYKNDANLFSFLLDISIGHALSGAILYSEINSFSGKLKGLNIYIDTPLILSLLGFGGEFKQKALVELINILNDEKANVFILRITREEVDAILSDCHSWLDKGNYDIEKSSRVLKFCIKNGITASDIEGKILTLDNLLESYKIFLNDVPAYAKNEAYQIDEIDLKRTIVGTYKNIARDFDSKDPIKDATIERDVQVLSGIYRFRKGHKPITIKDSKDIFITSNTALAFASRIFETKDNGKQFTIPTCLTDVFIGTVIWLQSPQKVVNLNEKKFIADCFSFIQPNEELLKRYIAEVEKLKKENRISNDEYYLLRTHRASINLLEVKTMGDPEEFNGETAEEILDNIISSIKQKESAKLSEEEEKHQQTKQDLNFEKERRTQLEQTIKSKANRISAIIGKVVFWILTILLIICTAINLFPELVNVSKIGKIIIWLIVGLITIFNVSIGFNIKGLKDVLIARLSKKIASWLTH